MNGTQTNLNGNRINNPPSSLRKSTKNGTRFWRQGDVVISERRTAFQPLNHAVNPAKEMTIKSETGHPHIIHATVLQQLVEPIERNGPGIITSTEPITVTHPQHATLTLPEGIYTVNLAGLPRHTRMFD